MRAMKRAQAANRWWVVGPALGATVMYLCGAGFNITTGRALDTVVWPPFVLLMGMMGAVLGLLTEGIQRLAGGRGWAVGLSLCLFPALILVLALIQTSQTPGMMFRWRSFLPFALLIEFFVIAYWMARCRLLQGEDAT